jgi:hypothetical protein
MLTHNCRTKWFNNMSGQLTDFHARVSMLNTAAGTHLQDNAASREFLRGAVCLGPILSPMTSIDDVAVTVLRKTAVSPPDGMDM